jgi:hypothetical protein
MVTVFKWVDEGDEAVLGWLPEREERFKLGLADARSLPTLASNPRQR